MKDLRKYAGVIIVLIGTAIIAIPPFLGATDNNVLLAGLVTIVVGILSFIALNKKAD
ncbi:MAG: hypothetical protein PHV20_07195 [Bacteroidales bacterium]|nr:hypothetical protein [Bacteroidales bacterium]